ncbi:MAG: aminopeptidase P family protein [Burkholderiales bacterium]|nr:aminopeptidase P family protein [Burkholderiales bacterium]
MQIHIDYARRIRALQDVLRRAGVDVLVATRLKTITHVTGTFVPWRSAAIVPAEGEVQVLTVSMDAVRVAEEGWLRRILPYGRTPMMDTAVRCVAELGLQQRRIGVEDGYSWYLPEGNITHEEYRMLERGCPGAEIVNVTDLIDRLMLIKEPEQIALMRQATAMCDSAQDRLRATVRLGQSEVEIAGIAEHELRARGSEFAWTFTGGQEIGSGHRSWTGACTPPTRKLVQRGEFVVLDVHGMYGLMLGDVSHNAILGKPTTAQERVIDAYVQTCTYMLEAVRPGRTIGEAAGAIRKFTLDNGWGGMIRGFGHGIGHFGNEWFPAFTDVYMPYVSDPDIVLQPNFLEIMALTCNLPGVGGLRFERPVVVTETGSECLSGTPIEPWVLGG